MIFHLCSRECNLTFDFIHLAYANCANEPFCAAKTIQGYMKKFGQDCNEDGVIDCYDYAAIHKHGGYGCKGPLPPAYANAFNTCISYALKKP